MCSNANKTVLKITIPVTVFVTASEWKFGAINFDEVLIKLICFLTEGMTESRRLRWHLGMS
jgi:hypothetical protein